MTPIGKILSENLLRASPNPENAFMTLIQGNIVFLKRKWSFFAFLKTQFFPDSGSISRVRERA
jgi:hypothetical protein